jgi:hypothetical protein
MLTRLSLVAAALLLAGCGYVGDPLPPALNIPARATDLAVVQTGDRLRISFTAPATTTEQLRIERYQEVDLRVGPIPATFSYDAWAATAQPVPVKYPEPGQPASVDLPAAPWAGRELLAAVRFRGSHGRYSEWSNSVAFTPREPLPQPVVRAAPDPEGIRVGWQPLPEANWRVWRKSAADAQPVEVATVKGPEFVDRNVSLGLTYTYIVQARRGQAESLPSAPVETVAADRFPPAPPTGLVANAGVNSVELAWERNNESDLGSYRIYRKEGDGAFTVIADAVEAVAFSDRQVQSGIRYSYQITALDKSGNESLPSAAISALLQ